MGAFGLDFTAGKQLFLAELYGDWYRDPWSWFDVTWGFEAFDRGFNIDRLVKKGVNGVEPRHTASFHNIEIPKSQLGVRPAVVADPASRLLYAAATASGLQQLHTDMAPWVFGWRSRERGANALARNSEEWRQYLQALNDEPPSRNALATDITSFFASIPVEPMMERLYQSLGNVAATSILDHIVRRHDASSGRHGIPQRSFPSAVLANYYLRPLDDFLDQQFRRNASVHSVTRWMDDITVVGSSEGALYALYVELQDRVRRLGLEVNSAKSMLVPVDNIADRMDIKQLARTVVRSVGRRSKYDDFDPEEIDLDDLTYVEAELIEMSGELPRTLTQAVLKQLREFGEYGKAYKWLDVAVRQPHLADGFGRYFRDYGETESDFGESEVWWDVINSWVAESLDEPWSALPWVASQWVLSIPASHVSDDLATRLQAWLTESADVQQVAVAAHRWWSRNPGACREIVRERLGRETDPLVLRVLGLALSMSHAPRDEVRRALAQDPRTQLTLDALEARAWVAPGVPADFDETKDS